MIVVLAVHALVALAAPLLFRAGRTVGFGVLAAVPAGSLAWLITQYGPTHAGPGAAITEGVPWVPQLDLALEFRMDALSWLFCVLILGVGALVLLYCTRYFHRDDASLASFGAQLLAFSGAMVGLVVADDLILLFVFWEITTILSYLLIGYNRNKLSARRSALQALVVTTAGGLAMLVGLIVLGTVAGTYRISAILALGPGLLEHGGAVAVALVLILAGAITKSALLPFHFWLPGAMAAPTPVSAYLHAAAMVKAGIYLVALFAPVFGESPLWRWLLLLVGAGTMLMGGWTALRQTDIKLVLAYGTVSQLGFLALTAGGGSRETALAGLALVLAHGLFKATLFLVVGIIDHQAGTRDTRQLSGVGAQAPLLAVVAVIGAASMAGIPFLGGFVAKESAYEAFVHAAEVDGVWGLLGLIGIVAGSVLTVAYSGRFLWGAFARKQGVEPIDFPAPSRLFLAAPVVLAVATVLYGVWPAPVNAWIEPYLQAFPADCAAADCADPYLALWHGFTVALGLTAITLALGLTLVVLRERIERLQAALPRMRAADIVYRDAINVLDIVAVWVTGRTQRGSLVFYLFIILSVFVVASVGAAALAGGPGGTAADSSRWLVADSPVQIAIGAGIVFGAVAATRASKRFLAVLMVSVTGYGMVVIFALQGAPDLALTQMLVETIVLVALVLALRVLPARLWRRAPSSFRVGRLVLALAVGGGMVFVAATAMAARTAEPISLAFPDLAYHGGGGSNIVNVTLVDIRAWDTFGEITVLAAAATGVASLVFVHGRGRPLQRATAEHIGSVGRTRATSARLDVARRFADTDREPWLLAGRTLAPERRSILFEVITRLVFHTMVLLSIFLLLNGHNAPGGGFAGGLVAGLALAVRYLAGGRYELAEATVLTAGQLLGVGLAIACASGVLPLFFGGEVFQTAILEMDWIVFGHVKVVTSTLFDIGVYLVVVGLVLDVLRSLGAEVDRRGEESPAFAEVGHR
ncbi:putative cation antiporter NADH dehydrogenase subunit [Tersicoccus solisilvae]|uniref:Cation antiporter NADH dehydrogenase subunit n=1 Tax=Tersicoccus solisilvae TaxID=1882339 RepID=A0ABQ1NLU3_9MICC|nr:Na+/H+ antiporter subunit A [Tersicoccus solisilvae]GGC80355.1 putative cation antiporter NADH dehydrogenase subunit [Tersicoccus solisilvae]